MRGPICQDGLQWKMAVTVIHKIIFNPQQAEVHELCTEESAHWDPFLLSTQYGTPSNKEIIEIHVPLYKVQHLL